MHEKSALLPAFEEFVLFIRDVTGYPTRKAITPDTLFEKDMGVTGDDGVELLEATSKRFGLDYSAFSAAFKLAPDEYLFTAEGAGVLPPLHWFGIGRRPVIRPFTVGDLYNAVCQAITR